MRLARSFSEDDLTQLASLDATFKFQLDLPPNGLVVCLCYDSTAAGTAAVVRIDICMGGAALDTKKLTHDCFWLARNGSAARRVYRGGCHYNSCIFAHQAMARFQTRRKQQEVEVQGNLLGRDSKDRHPCG